MSSYVIAYLNMDVGEIQLDLVDAPTELDALVDYFDLDAAAFNTLDLVYEYVSDIDGYLNICQI